MPGWGTCIGSTAGHQEVVESGFFTGLLLPAQDLPCQLSGTVHCCIWRAGMNTPQHQSAVITVNVTLRNRIALFFSCCKHSTILWQQLKNTEDEIVHLLLFMSVIECPFFLAKNTLQTCEEKLTRRNKEPSDIPKNAYSVPFGGTDEVRTGSGTGAAGSPFSDCTGNTGGLCPFALPAANPPELSQPQAVSLGKQLNPGPEQRGGPPEPPTHLRAPRS